MWNEARQERETEQKKNAKLNLKSSCDSDFFFFNFCFVFFHVVFNFSASPFSSFSSLRSKNCSRRFWRMRTALHWCKLHWESEKWANGKWKCAKGRENWRKSDKFLKACRNIRIRLAIKIRYFSRSSAAREAKCWSLLPFARDWERLCCVRGPVA